MQAAASTLRQSASKATRISKRHSSSQAPKPPAPHALSRDKMRALISLYHQSDTFITPENLSYRIDQAFTGKRRENELFAPIQQPGLSSLQYFRRQAELAPTFSEWDQEKKRFVAGSWSESSYSGREWKVIEALYGVDASGRLQPLPGLEALEEGNGGNIGLPPLEVDMSEVAESGVSLDRSTPNPKRRKSKQVQKKKGTEGGASRQH